MSITILKVIFVIVAILYYIVSLVLNIRLKIMNVKSSLLLILTGVGYVILSVIFVNWLWYWIAMDILCTISFVTCVIANRYFLFGKKN